MLAGNLVTSGFVRVDRLALMASPPDGAGGVARAIKTRKALESRHAEAIALFVGVTGQA